MNKEFGIVNLCGLVIRTGRDAVVNQRTKIEGVVLKACRTWPSGLGTSREHWLRRPTSAA